MTALTTVKKGAYATVGGIITLSVIIALGFGASFAYRYLTADRERLALLSDVKAACSHGQGDYRTVPADMDLLDRQMLLLDQRDAIADCTKAKLMVMQYDLR